MFCIGKVLIEFFLGVKFEQCDGVFFIEGLKGKIEQNGFEGFEVEVEGMMVIVKCSGESGFEKVKYGLLCLFLNNVVIGVIEGFKKEFDFVGVGYCGEVKG